MKFLVTGGTSFVGCHLINEILERGHEVWATSRRFNGSETDVLDVIPVKNFLKINWVFCDLNNKGSCEEIISLQPYDGLFHLAAQSHPYFSYDYPYLTYNVNTQGTINIVEAVEKFNKTTHFLYCSTSEVYGDPTLEPEEKMQESMPFNPISPYGASKTMSEIFINERSKISSMPFLVVRPFSHTGPKRGRRFSISSDAFQIACILKKIQSPVINVGNLETERAVMDVRDCVRAYVLLMENKSQGVYNVAAKKVHKMRYYLDIMLSAYGLYDKVSLVVDKSLFRKIDIRRQIADTKKIESEIKWECSIDTEKTLIDLVEYWLKKI